MRLLALASHAMIWKVKKQTDAYSRRGRRKLCGCSTTVTPFEEDGRG